MSSSTPEPFAIQDHFKTEFAGHGPNILIFKESFASEPNRQGALATEKSARRERNWPRVAEGRVNSPAGKVFYSNGF
jgi:hypothetical protein